KVFRGRYSGRACARIDCGAGSRSEGEGALCMLPRDTRSSANSRRRRVDPRFQAGGQGCFRCETSSRCPCMNLFLPIYRRPVKYEHTENKELDPMKTDTQQVFLQIVSVALAQ